MIAVASTSSTKALWYLTRGTGLVSLLLLTASVVLGIMESVRWARPRWPKLLTAGLHKNVSLLVVVFLAIHIITAVGDGFAPIGWLAVVVPFASPYRPLWLGFGAIAVDLLLAIILTSLVRQRLGYRAWRAVHFLAYACWPVALLHGLGTGSDTRLGWVLVISLGCLALVLGTAWWRVAARPPRGQTVRPLAVAASGAMALAIVGWLMVGPLRPGWARRAGTPASLISGTPPASAAPTGGGTANGATNNGATGNRATGNGNGTTTASGIRPPFRALFSGTVSQSSGRHDDDGGGLATVSITGTLSGGASGELRMVLRGPALAGGGVQMETSRATLGPTANPSQYQGQILSLEGTGMELQLRDQAGGTINLSVQLQIPGDGTVTGVVEAR